MNPRPRPIDDAEDGLIKKWLWKMDWCKQRGMPPADQATWYRAEEAWNAAPRGEK